MFITLLYIPITWLFYLPYMTTIICHKSTSSLSSLLIRCIISVNPIVSLVFHVWTFDRKQLYVVTQTITSLECVDKTRIVWLQRFSPSSTYQTQNHPLWWSSSGFNPIDEKWQKKKNSLIENKSNKFLSHISLNLLSGKVKQKKQRNRYPLENIDQKRKTTTMIS